MTLHPGTILKERYNIVNVIGEGGFGTVYQAYDSDFDTLRAIKENQDTFPEAFVQFKREAQLLDRLTHPNLPKVLDHFVVPGQGQYLVMEYIEGEDLQQIIKDAGGALQEAAVLQWIAQICDALTYMHTQSPAIIHRDIKPANIRIKPNGQAVLVDFGIARAFDPSRTASSSVKGVSPGYSSPEQYGGGATGVQSDIYSLGATLYHLLTGKMLPQSVHLASGGATIQLPRQLNPGLSPNAEKAILRCIEIDADRRYQSIEALKTELFKASGKPALDSRQRLMIASGVAAALLILLAGALLIGGRSGPDEPGSPQPAASATVALATNPGAASSETPSAPSTAAPATTDIPEPTLAPTPQLSTPLPPPPTALPERIVDQAGVEMALIPAGAFEMGSENGFPDELPVHKVTLPDYYIDIYEVTNALYRHCVDAGGCKPPHSESGRFWDSAYNSYPVTYLEWEMAKGYCSWRGARLPTEAEWEKAARGGLNSEPFPWGSARPVCQTGATEGVNYAECNQGSPLAVGSFAPNAFGLYDMSGNVWEWVADWYSENYYTARDVTSPSGPRSGAMRVIRGGSFNYGEIYIRVSNRGYLDPESYGSSGLGLRCARLP